MMEIFVGPDCASVLASCLHSINLQYKRKLLNPQTQVETLNMAKTHVNVQKRIHAFDVSFSWYLYLTRMLVRLVKRLSSITTCILRVGSCRDNVTPTEIGNR